MGGASTLHSAVLKDGVTQTPQSFDLRSWQGLTYVLKAGKEALTEPGAYAEFRNLVLQYAQQGGDAEIKKRIDAIIASFSSPLEVPVETKIEDVKEENKAPAAQPAVALVPEISLPTESQEVIGRRVEPRFGTEEKSVEAEVSAQEVHVDEPVEVAVAAPTSHTEPVASEPAIRIPIHSEPEEVSPKAPVFKTLEEHRARISEIKRIVNEHFGNPVALMGLKDNVGKIYMTTLLTALKATSAGGAGNAEASMTELEHAYTALLETEQQQATPVTEISPAKKIEKEEIPALAITPEVIVLPQAPLQAPVQAEVESTEVIPDTKAETTDLPVNEEIFREKDEEEIKEEPSRRDVFQSSFQKTDDTISSVIGSVHRNKHTAGDTLSALLTETDPNIRVQEVITPTPEIPTQVPAPEVLKEPKNVPSEEKKEPQNEWMSVRATTITPPVNLGQNTGVDLAQIAVKQSELFSPQITTMLNKLLHEWNIFSGSGLFGTGPAGAEHPLYVELAQLNMGEVLGGRWEGSDPKIVKVIKQYVDAWRHEQGITYTINETFEHYLRRVVQRILKRQNG